MFLKTPTMYTDSHFPNRARRNPRDSNGIPRPLDLNVITASITENAASEACYKMLMLMNGVDEFWLHTELQALNNVAKIRIKAAKDEADALVEVRYERAANSKLSYLTDLSWRRKTSLHIDPNLPNQTTVEPFHARDNALNEIRTDLISIYVQQIINYNTLIQMEALGHLNATAEETYKNAVSAAGDLQLDLFSAMTSLTQPQGESNVL